jgi:hypothetical protein
MNQNTNVASQLESFAHIKVVGVGGRRTDDQGRLVGC